MYYRATLGIYKARRYIMAIFSNQATLTFNGRSTTSNIAFGEILDVLSVTKTALETTYSPNGLATYVLTLRNTGTAPINALTVTDDLGGFTFGTGTVYPLTPDLTSFRVIINGVLQPAPTVTAGPPLTLTGLSIPAGGDAVIVYQARVNEFASPDADATVTNTATVTGGGLTAPVTAEAVLTATAEPVLSINKSISPSQVVDNERVTYTFIIQNTGNTAVTATDTAIITDTFNPILTDLAATLNGAPFTAYTYNEATGLFATNAGALTVPAATVTQDPVTGAYTVTPGTATLTVTGTI